MSANSGENTASSSTPVSKCSFSEIDRSKAIRAPIRFFANCPTASATVSKNSCFCVCEKENSLLLPNLAKALRNSGWKITSNATARPTNNDFNNHQITCNSNTSDNNDKPINNSIRPTSILAPRVFLNAR